MRIRKRKVPLPFSSLSPIPLSDPCFARFMPPVQHLLANSSPFSADSPPPDQAIDLDAPAAAPISPALNLKQAAGDIDREKIIITDAEGRNDFREKGIVGAHDVVALSHSQLPTTSSSSCFLDHEKAFPVKKRSSPWGSSEIVEQVDDDDDDDDDDQKEGSSNNIITSTSTAGTTANSSAGTAASLIVLKKRGRGGALMEGSRCSRVNGRGWRCCQPTLVGYSLCEHHLGKGRLRSITSSTTVRVGATQKNYKEKLQQQRPASVVVLETTTAANGSSTCQEEEEEEEVEGFIITKPVPMIRRRSSATKLGMVKARSISSLLDETTTTTTDQTTTNETISRSRPSVFNIGRRQ